MKRILLPVLLAVSGLSQAQDQSCCHGFEASFTFDHANNPLGLIVHNTSSGDWNAVIWHFGDGATDTGQNADHLYAEPGLYQVCLVIENNNGCRSELCRDVAVNLEQSPCPEHFVSDFIYEVNLENLTVDFTNTSGFNPEGFIWGFGDGATSYNHSPSHQYAEPGVYQVCFDLDDMGVCHSRYCREVCVEDFNPCEGFGADFSSVLSQSSPLQVNFHGSYSGDIDAIVWHFGDGTSSNAEHPEHLYAEPGTYEVCLVAENEEGCRSEYCVSVTVGTATQPCYDFEAGFTYVNGNNPLVVGFDNTSSGDWDFIIWHFGDGTTSNGQNPDHLYAEPGIYQVCVVIENNNDCRSEFCREVAVNVQENPCEEFIAQFSSMAAAGSLTAHFENTSEADAPFHVWHFGDGTSSDALHPDHTYAEAGTYQVCLVLESGDCRSEYCVSVTVGVEEDPCQGFMAGFSYDVNLTEGGVHFENLSSDGVTSIQWSFGDGHFSDDLEPVHEFDGTGLHQVCLRVENDHGCVAEFCLNVHLPAYYFHMVGPTAVEIVAEGAEAGLGLFPNPFTDVVRFAADGTCHVDVLDVSGRAVFTKGGVRNGSIDLGGLTRGLYLVRIVADDGSMHTGWAVKQ